MSKETQTRRKSPVFLLVCPHLQERRELVQDLGSAPSAQPPEGFPSTAGMQMTSGNWLVGTRMFHTHNIGESVGDTVGHRPPGARSSTCVALVCHLSRRCTGPLSSAVLVDLAGRPHCHGPHHSGTQHSWRTRLCARARVEQGARTGGSRESVAGFHSGKEPQGWARRLML